MIRKTNNLKKNLIDFILNSGITVYTTPNNRILTNIVETNKYANYGSPNKIKIELKGDIYCKFENNCHGNAIG